MLNIGPQELVLILVLALLVVGPRRLPEIGRSLGRGLREIRRAQEEVRKTIQVNLVEEERPTFPPRTETSVRREDSGTEHPLAGSAGSESASPVTAAAPPASAEPQPLGELSRTLGRSLAELRRAREEIQQTFRVNLDESPSPRPPAAPSRKPQPPPPQQERDVERAAEDAPDDDTTPK